MWKPIDFTISGWFSIFLVHKTCVCQNIQLHILVYLLCLSSSVRLIFVHHHHVTSIQIDESFFVSLFNKACEIVRFSNTDRYICASSLRNRRKMFVRVLDSSLLCWMYSVYNRMFFLLAEEMLFNLGDSAAERTEKCMALDIWRVVAFLRFVHDNVLFIYLYFDRPSSFFYTFIISFLIFKSVADAAAVRKIHKLWNCFRNNTFEQLNRSTNATKTSSWYLFLNYNRECALLRQSAHHGRLVPILLFSTVQHHLLLLVAELLLSSWCLWAVSCARTCYSNILVKAYENHFPRNKTKFTIHESVKIHCPVISVVRLIYCFEFDENVYTNQQS